jgi:hypothetical protein
MLECHREASDLLVLQGLLFAAASPCGQKGHPSGAKTAASGLHRAGDGMRGHVVVLVGSYSIGSGKPQHLAMQRGEE